jgi:two-component system, response regulator PhcR
MTIEPDRNGAMEGARTILFVDDEPKACKWFFRLFSNEFSILTAASADEALGILGARASEIAVLVTDYRMPVRNGLALLEAAQQGHRHVVRLLATAYAEKDVAVAAINQGRVMQILEKPFEEMQVREALREAVGAYAKSAREHALLEGRAAAMRETLGFLAHELNTPLATALGYLDALKNRFIAVDSGAIEGVAQIAEKRAGDTLAMVDAAGRRTAYAMSLVSTFVQSARDAYPGSSPAPTQASKLVNALLQEYPFESDERSWISTDLSLDFQLPGQPDLLYLVLCTLTKNALFALRGVRCLRDPLLRITLGRVPGQDLSTLCFADNGPGMAPAILERVTHEPVTTRAEQGGSGMGLLFCRRVVQSMGGAIEVDSGAGRGARITLTFNPDHSMGKN